MVNGSKGRLELEVVESNHADPARDGAPALLTGLAANRSMETGAPVRAGELPDLG